MATPEASGNFNGRWVEDIAGSITDALKIDSWAENALTEYSKLPRANSHERQRVRNLATQTAGRLLQYPQNIEIAADAWKTQSASFYELVKTESAGLIEKNWKDVTSEQLADLIGIHANSPSAQGFAKEMLKNYFRGPSNRRERIDAYYTLAYSTLHLIEDEKAFTQAIRIGLHDNSDILLKVPNLIEQTLFLSLPYDIFIFPNLLKIEEDAIDLFSLPKNKDKEKDFQRLLIAKDVMFQLSFLSLEDLGESRQKYRDFLNLDTNKKLMKKWTEEVVKAKKQVRSAKAITEINNATMEFDVRKGDSLSEEEKLELKKIWPFNLFFDETDPLKQEFKKVFPQEDRLPSQAL